MTRNVVPRAFGELAEFRNGVNFSAASRGSGDLAVIGVGDFQDRERLRDFGHLERIARPRGLEDDALLRDGDLIFVRSNGNRELIGRCMVLEGVQGTVSHSGFTIRARMKSSTVAPEWIAQYFATGLAKREIMRRGGGTNISNLSQQILEDLPIPVPRSDYQERVLTVAHGLSRVLEELDALLITKRTFKRGLMQQLLTGRQRFHEFRDRRWIRRTIGEMFEEVERPVEWDDEAQYRLVSIRRRSGGMFLRETKRGKDIKTKQLFTVRAGDIVISRMQVVHGAMAIVPPECDGYHVSGSYIVLVPRSTGVVSARFFNYLTQTQRVYHAAFVSSYGVHIEKMTFNPDWFYEYRVMMPSDVKEQERIAETLALADAEIDLLAAQRDQIELYKRGLLSRLLSGEIKVLA